MKIGDRVELPQILGRYQGYGTIILFEGSPTKTAWVNCDYAPSGYKYWTMAGEDGVMTVKDYDIETLSVVFKFNLTVTIPDSSAYSCTVEAISIEAAKEIAIEQAKDQTTRTDYNDWLVTEDNNVR